MIHTSFEQLDSKSYKRVLSEYRDASKKTSLSSNVHHVSPQTVDSTEHQVASLLLSVSSIVLKEINSEGIDWEDDLNSIPPPPISLVDTDNLYRRTNERYNINKAGDADDDANNRKSPVNNRLSGFMTSSSTFDLSRIRTVSMDMSEDGSSRGSSPALGCSSPSSPRSNTNMISPLHSPVSRRNPKRKVNIKFKNLPLNSKLCKIPTKKSVQAKGNTNGPVKTILRKKFSWKNYPELEAFLIANREEYLRHSALNYTVQQKQYNNKLTERLLELAADNGYVFDQEAFSFVTVRDRIRCYFKSYVQSAKKRGLIIGYAARKAGLLTEDDLERSANQTGRIVLPPTTSSSL